MQRLRAFCLIRQQPVYRHDAFEAGLAAAGYQVQHGWPIYPILPGEVFCIWNRYGDIEVAADKFEAAGGTVLVAENGYLGVDRADRKIYALAKRKHNGGGWWPHMDGLDGSRFAALGIELKPLRTAGAHILIAPNRTFGTRGNIMPLGWEQHAAAKIKSFTDRPIRIRPHPQNYDAKIPLAKDLDNCWAVAIWSSSVGAQALVSGIPVMCAAAWWIGFPAIFRISADEYETLEGFSARNFDKCRANALNRLAWAQWTVDEIQSGLPFKLLCTSTAPATSTA